jgi:mono/diheme cytochrome c family protein
MPYRFQRYAILRLAGPFALAAALLVAVLAAVSSTAAAQTQEEDPVRLGASLYAENCVVCHGEQGRGRVGAELAKDWPSIRPDLTVRTIIARGVPGSLMPAWSQANGGPLTEEEIDALTAYILSWQTGGAPQVTPRPTATLHPALTPPAQVEGDTAHGAALYAENCDMCHGPNGAGRVGATLARDWPSIRPDLSVRNTIANGVAGSPMPAFSQARGGPLSEQEINDVTAFILALGQSGQVVQVSPQPQSSDVLPGTPASEWVGLILFVVLFAAIIVAAMLLQRTRAS